MIDLHCHVLPGVDDGPPDLDATLALGRVAEANGTTVLVATPHVSYRYPTPPDVMHEGVDLVNEAFREAGIGIEVRRGAEVAPEMLGRLDDAELRALCLGGGPNLLLEAPLAAVGVELEEAISDLRSRDFGVVLAHPERCPSFHRDPDRLARLVGVGVFASVTAGSFSGAFGGTVQRLTANLARRGLVHDVSSDAHDAERRPPLMRAPLEAAEARLPGLREQIEWLTLTAPGALLAGTPPPRAPAPPVSPRRGVRLPWRSARRAD